MNQAMTWHIKGVLMSKHCNLLKKTLTGSGGLCVLRDSHLQRWKGKTLCWLSLTERSSWRVRLGWGFKCLSGHFRKVHSLHIQGPDHINILALTRAELARHPL